MIGKRIGIIGAGPAGLITAHTLIQDGFDVQLLTRDESVGGVWSEKKVYPGLSINSVHGEYEFSPMRMYKTSDTWLTGQDLKSYMQDFAGRFLSGRIRFNTDVQKIYRENDSSWVVEVEDLKHKSEGRLVFDKIVLCTGGCSTPRIPDNLSPSRAETLGFKGLMFHSNEFGAKVDEVLRTTSENDGHVVVIGGGKSAQDISAYLASQGRKVTIVYEKIDAFLASKKPLPDFIRRSRLLSLFSGHITLNSALERFLHTTWLGSKFLRFFWNDLAESSFKALSIPKDSPLRLTQPLFWTIRVGDAAIPRENSFYSLVNHNKINVVAPARATGYAAVSSPSRNILVQLNNGDELLANTVILATGYKSSWNRIFDDKTVEELGIGRHPPHATTEREPGSPNEEWRYRTLADPPPSHAEADQWTSSIYRGIVPAKNIGKRDFVINGAVFSTNHAYIYELTSHWISSYFLNDPMPTLPTTPEAAFKETEREARWIRKRFPDILLWANESFSANLKCWTWPQYSDELLQEMGLRSRRSGGNWLTWPFKVIDMSELGTLGEERKLRRDQAR